MDIADVGILLWGITLGWFLMFAIRRYKVHWGAFGTFLSVIMGSTLVKFLYAAELLPWYGIGLFIGVFGNVIARFTGAVVGGRAGEGLLEISAFSVKSKGGETDDTGRDTEGEGTA
ncbi:MAG: hypothetical protein ACE5LS_07955 [Thermoplasmata archaeon]